MDIKIINFDDTEIEKYKFYQDKSPILINNIDINKIVVSNNISITMSVQRRDFDQNKYRSFLIKDEKLLEKYFIVRKSQQHDQKRI